MDEMPSIRLGCLELDKFSKKIFVVYVIILIIVSFSPMVCPSDTPLDGGSNIVYVYNDADSGWYNSTRVRTIQEAINNVSQGGTVYVWDGIYNESLEIDKSMSLIGNSTESVILNGTNDAIKVTESNVNIKNLTIISNNLKKGIYLLNTDNCVIGNNNIKNNQYGIYLTYSSNNNITNNNITNNMVSGISINGDNINHATNNNISNNDITNNGYDGIYLTIWVEYNNITNNNITNNGNNGIYLYDQVNHNNITNNNIKNNYQNGLRLYGAGCASYNNIQNNNITGNYDYGIIINGCTNNLIYNNYFDNINNTKATGNNNWNITPRSGTNILGGEYLGGNYWSDYTGYDTDKDGLGDDPYFISTGVYDYHPLTHRIDVVYVDDNASTSWYDSNHVNTIQEGIHNVSTNGTVYIWNGTYENEFLEINKSLNLIGNNSENTIINGSSNNNVINITANNVLIRNLTIMQKTGYKGIYFDHCQRVNVTNCNIYPYGPDSLLTYECVYLNYSCNCIISSNKMNETAYSAIRLEKSDYNTITSNTVHDTIDKCIWLRDSNNNNITSNYIYGSRNALGAGIYLNACDSNDSHNNKICMNEIFNNSNGIWLNLVSNNSIYKNSIYNNIKYGITVAHSENNTIYHNNIFNNTVNGDDDSDNNNTWYNSTLNEGNYWGNYTTTYENATYSNGIWGTPYEINGTFSCNDSYPLVSRFEGYYNLSIILSSNTVTKGNTFTATIETQGETLVQNAIVTFNSLSNVTDSNGQSTFTAGSAGTYQITATKDGYTSASATLTVKNSGGGVTQTPPTLIDETETPATNNTNNENTIETTNETTNENVNETTEPISTNPSEEIIIGNTTSNETISTNITNSDDLIIVRINISAKVSMINFTIFVEKIESKPEQIEDFVLTNESIYTYININISSNQTHVSDVNISKSKITFKVEKEWIIENEINISSIKLLRYNSTWKELSTSFLTEDEKYCFFEAETPGFSTFAVVGSKIIEKQEKDNPDDTGLPWYFIVGFTVAILLIIIVVLFKAKFIYLEQNEEKK